ncbi:hypothetical protein [Moorena producens]|uniref:hypothetical protein n=1 Tax=Moorena producens TaxID=1155739 RepID=UPI003C746CBE
MGRWGNGEMGKWGDGEMGRWGNGEMGKWGDGEMGKWGDGENSLSLAPYAVTNRGNALSWAHPSFKFL